MKGVSILFENSEILLVNKEAGVSVQGGAGVAHPLDEELSKELGYKIHLVHRLDKDTAGILIVAKSPAAATKWIGLIGSKEVSKEYTAICIGKPAGGKAGQEGTLEGTVEAHGRTQKALSRYRVERTGLVPFPQAEGSPCPPEAADEKSDGKSDGKIPGSPDGIPLCLLSIRIETGRMHQIRIQTAQAGFPIAGDDQHGDFKKNKMLRKAGIKKLMLASTRLTIPLDGELKTFEIPLPHHMQDAVGRLF
ncbi:MAG: RluA family pseudouridine synthase [Treponema sp.]|nr:RluA family pseudouridine synthase [Treponema sp.]